MRVMQRVNSQICKIKRRHDKYISDPTICNCLLWGEVKLHNINWGEIMSLNQTGDGAKIEEGTVQTRALGRLNALKLFGFALLKHAGLFLLGIMVGMGIVLKNPPTNTELINKLKQLEAQESRSSTGLVVKQSISFE